MIKKIIALFIAITTVLSFGVSVQAAKVGDVIGTVYNTDIVAYVNHYAIPSYAVNGTSVIVAEDLRNFGFDVIWDGASRSLNIYRNNNIYPAEMTFQKTGTTGSKMADLLYTDIKVYVQGQLVPSYSINGYTMVPVESLTMLGQCMWVPEQRAIKLWVDGLNIRSEMQYVEIVRDYTGGWTWANMPNNYNFTVYKQSGNKIDIYIEAIKGQGQRLGMCVVENVEVVNGKARFYYVDSFMGRGYGNLEFKGNSAYLTYDVIESGLGWDITTGGNKTYTKEKELYELDMSWFDPEDYKFDE